MDITLSEGYLKLYGILSGSMSYGRESLIIGYRQFEDETKDFGSPREEIMYFDRDNSWKEELDDFAKCILENKPIEMGSSIDALRSMEMVYSVYKADKAWSMKWQLDSQ
jgi:predicted dehydrogenase